MRLLRSLLNIGTFILVFVVPLIAWTGFYDGVEEPKMAATLWATGLVVCAWLIGCLSERLRFMPRSSHIKVGAAAYILLAASAYWAGLKLHLMEYAIFYVSGALLLLAWDSILASPLMLSLFIDKEARTDPTTQGQANSHPPEEKILSVTSESSAATPEPKTLTPSCSPSAPPEKTPPNIAPTENSDAAFQFHSNQHAPAEEVRYIWNLIGWLSLACLIAGLYSCLQKITPLQISLFGLVIGDPMSWNYPHLSQGRTIATFGNPNYSGVWFAAVLPLSLSWLLTCLNDKRARIAALLAWLLCAIVIVITQTRAAWLGFGIGMVIWFVTMAAAYTNKKIVIKIGISTVAGLIALSTLYIACAEQNLGGNDINQYTVAERVKSFTNLNDPSLQARLWFWKSALKTALAFPWTGVGPYGQIEANLLERNSEPMVTRPYGQLPTSTHNQLFHVLATAGWPAFILYLISIAFTLNSARQIKCVPLRAAFLSSIACLWTAHIFTSFTVSSELLWIFIMAAVSAASPTSSYQQQPTDDQYLNQSLMEMNGRVHLAIFIGTVIMFATTVAVLMDFASLRLGSLGNQYCREAQRLQRTNNVSTAEILLTYDQANACYELASALSPAWMTWQYNLEISRVFTEINYKVLPAPDGKILFKAIEYASIAAAYAPDKTLPLTNLAYIFSREPQNLPQAIRTINQALYLDPRNPKILILKANCLTEMNQLQEALKILDYVDSITPNLPASLYDRLVIYTYLGEDQKAERIMNRLADLDQQAYQAALSFVQRRQNAIQSSKAAQTREKAKHGELQQQSN
ncbi:MAG: O-antigen ligase family protein [Candidatus Bruticola sp.]